MMQLKNYLLRLWTTNMIMALKQVAIVTRSKDTTISSQVRFIANTIIDSWNYMYKLWETERVVTFYWIDIKDILSMKTPELKLVRVEVKVA